MLQSIVRFFFKQRNPRVDTGNETNSCPHPRARVPLLPAVCCVNLVGFCKSLGGELRPTEIEAAVIIMDEDNDGKISLAEFEAWWSRRDPPAIV